MATTRKHEAVRDDYLELIKAFPLRPIRTGADHAAALEMTGGLIGAARKLTSGETDYLEALAMLVEDFERKEMRVADPVPGMELLKFLLDESGTGVGNFGKIIGVGKSAASLILSGKRDLTKNHITKLAHHFKVGPQAFFG